ILTLAAAETFAAVPKPLLNLAINILTGAGASFAASKASEAESLYVARDRVAKELKLQGLDPSGGAIYSLVFQVDPNASDRWFFNPNVYALVQLEGQPDY